MAETHEGSRKQPDYQSYLLRLWPAESRDQGVWRASLQSAATGEQIAFADIEELFDYLRARTTCPPEFVRQTAELVQKKPRRVK